MVRGRLIELNHQPIFEAVPLSARGQNALHRELNLSWMSKLPSDNKVVEGSWWNESSYKQPLISIEKDLADNLGVKQDDLLTFQIGDQQLTGKVNNLRTLDWASFHPNFYIIFPPGVLERFPTTYITSFYLSPDKVNQRILSVGNIGGIYGCAVCNADQLVRCPLLAAHYVCLSDQFIFMGRYFGLILPDYSCVSIYAPDSKNTAAIERIVPLPA